MQQKGKLRHEARSTWLGGTRSVLAWASHGIGSSNPALMPGRETDLALGLCSPKRGTKPLGSSEAAEPALGITLT